MTWKPGRSDEDFSAEIESHIALEADRLMAEGLSEQDALAAARKRFGNPTLVREDFYEAGHWRWFDELRRNLSGAIRLWRRRPLLAIAAVLTIALGTGLNTALFHIVWDALLRQLPYAAAGQLVNVWRVDRTADVRFNPRDRRLPDGLTIERWRERSHSFDGLASYRPWRATVGSGGDPERVVAGLVSADFFSALEIPFAYGRAFKAAEVRPGADDVVALSYGYWKRRFGGRADVVGTNILVDGRLCRVAGVLGNGRWGLIVSAAVEPDVYLPFSKAATGSLKVSSGWVVARLKPGVSAAAARDELAELARESAHDQSKPVEQNGVNITPLAESIAYDLRPALLILFGATACVLLIACINVANLLLAQASTRRQELAIRAALGASRGRLVRQLLTEAFLLALAGGIVGIALAQVLTRVVVSLYPGTLPRVQEGGESMAMLAFTMAVIVLCTVLFGILPSLHVTSARTALSLRTSRGWMASRTIRWRSGLAGFQVALTVVLLASAGLLLKSFVNLRSTGLGFEKSHIFTAQVVLPDARYSDKAGQARFARQWVERLRAIPGVEGAALTNSIPLAFNMLLTVDFYIPALEEENRAGARTVAGDYFKVLGLQMKEGRPLTAADDDRKDVVVVNESFERRFFKGRTAVGSAFRSGKRPLGTVVGVVRDLRNLELQRPAEPEIYLPFGALPGAFLDVLIRSTVQPEALASAARTELRSLDPGLVLAQISTMDQIVDGQVSAPRFHAVLLGLFAAVAIALAAVGVYGVVAQGVRARTAEFGVRTAMGARPADLFRLVLGQGMRAPLVGLGVGIAASLACGRFLQSQLYGVQSYDPAVLIGAAAFVVLISLGACGLPGWYAASVDAARALREE